MKSLAEKLNLQGVRRKNKLNLQGVKIGEIA